MCHCCILLMSHLFTTSGVEYKHVLPLWGVFEGEDAMDRMIATGEEWIPQVPGLEKKLGLYSPL